MLLRLFIVCIVSGVSSASADVTRLKLRPSTGELVHVEKACGHEIQQAVWKLVFRAPYIEIEGDTMIAAVDEKKREADSYINIRGVRFVGHFDQSEEKTIAISIRNREAKRRFTAVDLTILIRGPDGVCSEKWLGLAERL